MAGSALLCFGGLGVAAIAVLGQTLPALIGYFIAATAIYVALLYRFRVRVELPLLLQTVSRGRIRVSVPG